MLNFRAEFSPRPPDPTNDIIHSALSPPTATHAMSDPPILIKLTQAINELLFPTPARLYSTELRVSYHSHGASAIPALANTSVSIVAGVVDDRAFLARKGVFVRDEIQFCGKEVEVL